jgi:hypothetical protein
MLFSLPRWFCTDSKSTPKQKILKPAGTIQVNWEVAEPLAQEVSTMIQRKGDLANEIKRFFIGRRNNREGGIN